MSLDIWPFSIETVREDYVPPIESGKPSDETLAMPMRQIGDADIFVAEATVFFPQPETGKKPLDLWEQWRKHKWGALTFLYVPRGPEHYHFEDEILGSGDGVKLVFAFSAAPGDLLKHQDLTKLVVKVGGTPQVEGAGDDYLVSNNDVDPTITFNAGKAPTTGADNVTVTGQGRIPVLHARKPSVIHKLGGISLASPGQRLFNVLLREQQGGDRFA